MSKDKREELLQVGASKPHCLKCRKQLNETIGNICLCCAREVTIASGADANGWISVDNPPKTDGYKWFVNGQHLPFTGMYYKDEMEVHVGDEVYNLSELTHYKPIDNPVKL